MVIPGVPMTKTGKEINEIMKKVKQYRA